MRYFVGIIIGLISISFYPLKAQEQTNFDFLEDLNLPTTSLETKDINKDFTNQEVIEKHIAQIGVLDKITAQITSLDIPVGTRGRIYNLDILALACQLNPPSQLTEAAGYLEIGESKKIGTLPNPLFKGWMFSEKQSLNVFDHPVYDVWLINCL